jgi:hypothetical protein
MGLRVDAMLGRWSQRAVSRLLVQLVTERRALGRFHFREIERVQLLARHVPDQGTIELLDDFFSEDWHHCTIG